MGNIKVLLVELVVIAIIWWLVTRLTLPAPVAMIVEVALAIAAIVFLLRWSGVSIPGF